MNKIKTLIVALMAVLATGAGVLVSTAPAQAAGNPPCITRAEFNRIHNGQSLTQVKRIVGGVGRISLSSSFMTIRTFNTCTAWHVSNVSFQHGRVMSKLYI